MGMRKFEFVLLIACCLLLLRTAVSLAPVAFSSTSALMSPPASRDLRSYPSSSSKGGKGGKGGSSKSSSKSSSKGSSKSGKGGSSKGGSKSGKGGSSKGSSKGGKGKGRPPRFYPGRDGVRVEMEIPDSEFRCRGGMGKGKGKGGPRHDDCREYPGDGDYYDPEDDGGGETRIYDRDGVPHVCTVRGTTMFPRHHWCPDEIFDSYGDDGYYDDGSHGGGDEEGSDDGGEGDGSEDLFAEYCEAVKRGSAYVRHEYSETFSLEFTVEIVGDLYDTLENIETFFQKELAAWLVGCGLSKPDIGDDLIIDNVIFEVDQESTFSGNSEVEGCGDCVTTDVTAEVQYTGTSGDSSDDSDTLEKAIQDAFDEHCDMIEDIRGVGDGYDPCGSLTVTNIDDDSSGGGVGGGSDTDGSGSDGSGSDGSGSDGSGSDGSGSDGSGSDGSDPDDSGSDGYGPGSGSENGTGSGDGDSEDGDRGAVAPVVTDVSEEKSTEEDRISGAGIFGILLALLLLLLLLLLFVRRRRKNSGDVVKHEPFEDVGPDDTFMLDSADSPSSMNRSAQIDDDSRFGMYPQGQTEGMILGDRSLKQDVHKCASATCDLCEQRRQAGLQFLPAQGPLEQQHEQVLMAPSTRAYGAEDTVHL